MQPVVDNYESMSMDAHDAKYVNEHMNIVMNQSHNLASGSSAVSTQAVR